MMSPRMANVMAVAMSERQLARKRRGRFTSGDDNADQPEMKPDNISPGFAMEPKRLEGFTALVTGAARGVGKGIALELARAGCRIAVNDLSPGDLAAETVAEINALGVDAFAVGADVRVQAEVRDMVETVVARFGRLNI